MLWSEHRIGSATNLLMFMCRPDASPNKSKMHLQIARSIGSGFTNKTTSSAKIESLFFIHVVAKARKNPRSAAHSNNLWSGFMVRMKSIDDTGHLVVGPCSCI